MSVGPELGRGVRSIVYAFGEHDVAKIATAGTPDEWLVEELRIADSAARAGAPVSGGRRLVRIDGRQALVSLRIDGPSMWDAVRSDLDRADAFGVELAELQLRIWACVPSYELPEQRDRVAGKVYAAAARHGEDLAAAIDVMPSRTDRLVLCHGDLHPRNVLLSPGRPGVVDWFDAARGTAEADAARTELMLRSLDELEAGVTSAMGASLERLADAYRASIVGSGRCDADLIDRWRVVHRVARLAEGFGVGKLDEVRAELRAIE